MSKQTNDNRLLKKISRTGRWKKIKPLNKGWSKDVKYHLWDNQGDEYLIRISDISILETKQKQFDILKEVEKLGINAPKPVEFGKLDDNHIYTILTWLEGEDAEKQVVKMTDLKQYELGIEAGKIMKKLHTIPIYGIADKTWWERYQVKIEKKIVAIKSCSIELPKRDLIIDFVLNNMDLVKERKSQFQHGDYHLGNMIVNHGKIGIIDFDKTGIADPYDEFKPFCWNVFKSPYFETGLIDGYFDNNIPPDFFPILALYAAESLLSHLPWAIPFGNKEIKTALQVSSAVLEWYDNFTRIVPSWYMNKSYRR